MREKACRTCKRIVGEEKICPNCQGTTFTTFWRGMVDIVDFEKSEIAKKMNITSNGKFALRLSR